MDPSEEWTRDDAFPPLLLGGGAPEPRQGEEMARSRSKHRRKQMKIKQHWKKRRERKKAAAAK